MYLYHRPPPLCVQRLQCPFPRHHRHHGRDLLLQQDCHHQGDHHHQRDLEDRYNSLMINGNSSCNNTMNPRSSKTCIRQFIKKCLISNFSSIKSIIHNIISSSSSSKQCATTCRCSSRCSNRCNTCRISNSRCS